MYEACKRYDILFEWKYFCSTIEDFKDHMDYLFEDTPFTWDNYGEIWEMDHIIPIGYNNPTKEEVIERLSFENVQPLSKKENKAKGNRYTD